MAASLTERSLIVATLEREDVEFTLTGDELRANGCLLTFDEDDNLIDLEADCTCAEERKEPSIGWWATIAVLLTCGTAMICLGHTDGGSALIVGAVFMVVVSY